MEKVIVALWGPGLRAGDPASPREIAAALRTAGASRIRLNLRDPRVAAGAALEQINAQPPADAFAQFWLQSARHACWTKVGEALRKHCDRLAAWLVAESTIIENHAHPSRAGEATWGFSQIALLRVPPRLTHEAWRTQWQDAHTEVAIRTQANFEYVHNLVVRPLTEAAPEMAAFVEECFPLDALTDPQVFFDARGEPQKFERNLAAMMESCGRFIDFDRIDVLISSQYDAGVAG